MFSSVKMRAPDVRGVSVLQGYRVLVTGVSSGRGVDTAQAFCERPTAVALYASDDTQDMVELAAHLAQGEGDVRLFDMESAGGTGAIAFARRAAVELGGFDAVVNFASLSARDVERLAFGDDVEAVVSRALEPMFAVTDIALNRMRLTLTEGVILNVVTLEGPRSPALSLLGDVARAMISDVTRGLARDWAKHGIRINSVAPASSMSMQLTGSTAPSSQDVAELAMYVTSEEARGLSGHLLDAEGYASRYC